ncbi:MAG: hypothetical protein AAB662_04220, partial [Patescibacteria group bacterium]
LPRKEPTQTTPKPINKQQTISVSAGDLSSADLKTLNNITQAFSDNLLLPLYQTKIDLKRSILKSGQTPLFLYAASYSWQAENISSQLSISYDTDKKPLNINLFITVPNSSNIVSSSSANVFASKYLILPENIQWLCASYPEVKIERCNTIASQKDSSRLEISVTSNAQNGPNNVVVDINACRIFPNSSRDIWSACLTKRNVYDTK